MVVTPGSLRCGLISERSAAVEQIELLVTVVDYP